MCMHAHTDTHNIRTYIRAHTCTHTRTHTRTHTTPTYHYLVFTNEQRVGRRPHRGVVVDVLHVEHHAGGLPQRRHAAVRDVDEQLVRLGLRVRVDGVHQRDGVGGPNHVQHVRVACTGENNRGGVLIMVRIMVI